MIARVVMLIALLVGLSACCAVYKPPIDALVWSLPAEPGDAVVASGFDDVALATLTSLAPDDPRWANVLALRVDMDNGASDAPSMLGTYSLDGNVLRFKPRFPLQRGQAYRVTVNRAGLLVPAPTGSIETRTFALADDIHVEPTRVYAVYPSADELPENLLKFYVQFTAPMSRGDSYRHIQLLDGAGKRVDLPFLELPQELWNREGTRLTLLLDPGRVKQGLKPRDDEGPILISGKRYTLVIGSDWFDANGRPLAEGARKQFTAADADVTQPDPATWDVATPEANTTEPLSIHFSEPLDRGMLQDAMFVRSADGRTVVGVITVRDAERQWLFRPEKQWTPGRYEVVIATTLEDRAGNSIGRAFEVDLKKSPSATPAPATVTLTLDVK